MKIGQWIKGRWLDAQGVPWRDHWRWRNETLFETYPHTCVVCGRPWRPGLPEYVGLFGETRLGDDGPEWHWKGVTASTGLAPGQRQMRYICIEHPDLFDAVPDCQTGEMVLMVPPPSRGERAWRDVRYWAKCALRFIWLVGQWIYLWTAYKVTGYRAEYVRAPWPPIHRA